MEMEKNCKYPSHALSWRSENVAFRSSMFLFLHRDVILKSEEYYCRFESSVTPAK
jgi:hypothetical protein